MNRRHFLQLLASVPAAAVLTPRILETVHTMSVWDPGRQPIAVGARIVCLSTPTRYEARWIRDAFLNTREELWIETRAEMREWMNRTIPEHYVVLDELSPPVFDEVLDRLCHAPPASSVHRGRRVGDP